MLGTKPGDAVFDRLVRGIHIQAFAAEYRAGLGHAQKARSHGAGALGGQPGTQGRVVGDAQWASAVVIEDALRNTRRTVSRLTPKR